MPGTRNTDDRRPEVDFDARHDFPPTEPDRPDAETVKRNGPNFTVLRALRPFATAEVCQADPYGHRPSPQLASKALRAVPYLPVQPTPDDPTRSLGALAFAAVLDSTAGYSGLDPGDLIAEAVGILQGDRPAWWARAACRGQGPEQWFPERGDRPDHAKAVCARCPVRAECLDAAVANREAAGVWGGMSPGERRPRRRRAA